MPFLETVKQFTWKADDGRELARRTVYDDREELHLRNADGSWQQINLNASQLADLAELYGFGASSVDPAGPQPDPPRAVDPAALTEAHAATPPVVDPEALARVRADAERVVLTPKRPKRNTPAAAE